MKKSLLIILALALAPATSFAQSSAKKITTFSISPGPAYNLSEDELKTILRGKELVVVDDPDSQGRSFIHAATIVMATPSEVYKILADFGNYTNIMPNMKEMKVVEKNGNELTLDQTITVRVAKIPIDTSYKTKMTLFPEKGMQWYFIEGDLGDTAGAWHLRSVAGGRITVVIHTAYVDLAGAGWLVKQVLDSQPALGLAINTSSTVMAVRSLKNYVEKNKNK